MGARFNLERRSFAKADQIDRGLTFYRERMSKQQKYRHRCDNWVAVLKHSINEDADHTNPK